MKIVQVVPWLGYGDAIGNDVLAIDLSIKEKKFETKIYAEGIDARIQKGLAENVKNLEVQTEDIVILHLSAWAKSNDLVANLNCKKVMIYHNITPPVYFEYYDKKNAQQCASGLEQLKELKNSFDMVLAVSEYNRQNLLEMGYKCEINILPIIIPFNDYDKNPSTKVLKKFEDNYTNILFLGRIVPNKKHEDVIAAFDFYQKNYNPKSRLFLVGNPNGCENYAEQLKIYAKELGTKNVFFTGHTAFNEILAYYKLADLFLCQSEHEGFCVPLIEAMYFNLPILAYSSSAIPDTLNGSGFLTKEKNPALTGALINKILTDEALKKTIIENQQERLLDFECKKIQSLFWKYMEKLIN